MSDRLRLANGSYRWMRARAAPRRDPQGHIIRWYGTLEDVHEHKVLAEAFRQLTDFGLAGSQTEPAREDV